MSGVRVGVDGGCEDYEDADNGDGENFVYISDFYHDRSCGNGTMTASTSSRV